MLSSDFSLSVSTFSSSFLPGVTDSFSSVCELQNQISHDLDSSYDPLLIDPSKHDEAGQSLMEMKSTPYPLSASFLSASPDIQELCQKVYQESLTIGSSQVSESHIDVDTALDFLQY